MAVHGSAWQGMAVVTWHGLAVLGKVRQPRYGGAGQGMARRGMARQGSHATVWRGSARHGMARPGMAG